MTSDAYRPSPLAQVDSEATEDRWTLVFTRDLRHPPEKVWAALTEPEQLAAWAPYTADRDLSKAGDATLTMIDDENSQDLAAEVVRVEPPTLLEYTLGTDLLRWELAATDTGSRLTLRHTVKDRDWLPKVAAGWHICLDVAEKLLDGRPIPPIRGAAAVKFGWSELNDQYARKFGIPNTGLPEHLEGGDKAS
ncbi:SRPBCC family protein [Nonomuraea guangzhouensis]|uniref:SRPBCC family protein n=1 Tax=Nonomuraea guangzhouensis TaxID=1291555 RepID=A0ABW4G0U7_9ACTN|nr:SRPBCC family protein [Nonomuraea guangzhouensis]